MTSSGPAYDVTVDPRRPRTDLVATLRAAAVPDGYAEADAALCGAFVEENPNDETSRIRFQSGSR